MTVAVIFITWPADKVAPVRESAHRERRNRNWTRHLFARRILWTRNCWPSPPWQQRPARRTHKAAWPCTASSMPVSATW